VRLSFLLAASLATRPPAASGRADEYAIFKVTHDTNFPPRVRSIIHQIALVRQKTRAYSFNMMSITEQPVTFTGLSNMPTDSQSLFTHLSTQQFLHPHRSLKRALDLAVRELHYCPAGSDRAMHWLDIEPHQLVGRIRRTELAQLARSTHRFSKQIKATVDRPARTACVDA